PTGTRARIWVWTLAGTWGLVVLTMGAGNGVGTAAEWSAAPSLSVKGVYNSNLLLSGGNNEVIGHWVTPDLKFKGATENFEVQGETRADFIHYYGSNERELTNLYFPLRASYRLDRHSFEFDGGFTRDNTLVGELQRTGLVLGFTQRSMWTAMPTWKIGITERLSWKSGYHFMDAQYQDGSRLGFANYQVHGVNAGPTYHLTELDEVSLTGEYNLVRIPSVGLESTYYGAQGSWVHDFGNQLIGSISGGSRLVSSAQDVPAIPGILGILLGRSRDRTLTSEEVVWVYRGSLRKQFERTTVQIDGSREINPSGFGRLLQTDRVGGSLSHSISESINLSVSGALYFVSGLSTTEGSRPLPRTTFFSVSPTLSWQFAQWWSVAVSYTYAERAVDDLDQRYNSNSTFIMLTYGGDKWSVSR
ncbi:MAG: hypothetical protein ABL983_19085, partial [Nitrospira sp.]